MITTICLSVAATALLVPFIKVTCEHYSASEKQKRAAWKRKNSPPTLTPEATIAAFVALTAEQRQSRRDSFWVSLLPLLGLALFFWHPIIALFCLPITIGLAFAALSFEYPPSGAPSEEEIFRAEVLARLQR